MNSYAPGPTQRPARLPELPTTTRPKIPGTLTGAAVFAGLAGLIGILTLVVTNASGESMVLDAAAKLAGVPSSELAGDESVQFALQDAFDILQSRAVFFAVFGVIFLALLLPLRLGMTWARIVYSICAPISLALLVYTLLDEGVPAALKLMDAANALAALVALVLIWAGPSNAVSRARKAAKRSDQQALAA
ncbi:hypothetical protein [Labedaea rhizosphaerae]|uniref:Uncharacterized protein n=1 Tax=Labedaea rhizosphaerae TaxID=598644 RepID=A0A4R6S530_LABRH|nr:hypothetical protein [Labedaea rhizosphaerae]TDP94889.1 hypothetical protein EV186_105121 [Labedaea rhizosphaerae]